MKKIIGLCLMAVLLTGCTAEMMERRGDDIHLLAIRRAKQTRGGVVRYLNTGLKAWRRSRRADAEKKMRQYCAGEYTIVAEGPRSQFGADMPIGKSVSVEVDQYWYISFDCVKQPTE